jgi:hypothetical protein
MPIAIAGREPATRRMSALLTIVEAAGGHQLEVELRGGELAPTTAVVQPLEVHCMCAAKRRKSVA